MRPSRGRTQSTPYDLSIPCDVGNRSGGDNSDRNALLRNALATRSLDSLMPSVPVNRTFAVTLGREVSAQNQASSGRCWIFANISAIRRALVKRLGWAHDFTLSASFVYFHSMLEQCNTALEVNYEQALRGVRLGSCEFMGEAWRPTDGGDLHNFLALVEKYGIVPVDAYPDSYPAQHSGDVGALLRHTLRGAAMELFPVGSTHIATDIAQVVSRPAFDALKHRVLTSVRRTLSALLGPPPQRFRFVARLHAEGGTRAFDAAAAPLKGGRVEGTSRARVRTQERDLTPLEFYAHYVRGALDPDRLVHLADDPRHLRHAWIAPQRSVRVLTPGIPVADLDNLVADLYWNVGSATMKAATLRCLSAGRAVIFACDVGQFYSERLGYLGRQASSLPRLFPGVDAWELAAQPESKARCMNAQLFGANHEMAFIGHDAATDTWEVENSWGASRPLTMCGEWFDRFVYSVCVPDPSLAAAERRVLLTKGRASRPAVANATAFGMPLDERNKSDRCGASGRL